MKYRLYVDESGDHNYKNLDDPSRRYLCLMGCIVEYDQNRLSFTPEVEKLKQQHFPYDPDDGQIPSFHRSDLIKKVGVFSSLSNPNNQSAFDEGLLVLLRDQNYTLITVVIDKARHKQRYGHFAEHPYHRCLEILLERYCGFLKYFDGTGDVMAEARGKTEDNLLRDAYRHFYHNGSKYGSKVTSLQDIRNTLSSGEIKLKLKTANVAGLQIADLLAYPCRQGILAEKAKIPPLGNIFGARVWECVQPKFNRHYGVNKIDGYGWVFIEP